MQSILNGIYFTILANIEEWETCVVQTKAIKNFIY